MISVLKLDPSIASAFFSVVCFSAPITGTVCGGAIVSYLGGYKAKSVQSLLIVVAWICVFVVIPIPFMTTLNTWGMLVWILLFLGGFILPTMTGLMLGAVSQN